VRQQDTNTPYGGALPGGGYCPVTQILESPSRDIRFLKVKILGIPWGHRPQRGEDLSGTDIYHFVHFHSDRHKMTVPRQKYTFSLADSPRGLLSFVFVIRENDMIMYRPWRHVYCCNDVTFVVVIICIQFFSFVPLSLLSQSQRRHSMEWANFNAPSPQNRYPWTDRQKIGTVRPQKDSYTKFGTNLPTEGFWENGWNITKIIFYYFIYSYLFLRLAYSWDQLMDLYTW